MKNHLLKFQLLALASLFILGSCSKDSRSELKPDAEKELYDVSFRVKSFKQEIVPIASTSPIEGTSEIDPSIYKIQYLIYDAEGNRIVSVEQLNYDEGFGSLSIRLPAGDFRILAWATSGETGDMTASNYSHNDTQLHAYDGSFQIYDSFFADIDFSVSESSYVNELILQRQTAKIEIDLAGELPENTSKIIVFYDSPVSLMPFGNGYHGVGQSRIERIFEELEGYKTETGYSLNMLVLPQFDETPYLFDLTITCQDEDGNMLYHEVIEDVEVFRNKMTVLTGSITENEADNSEFFVNVNTGWDDNHDEVNF